MQLEDEEYYFKCPNCPTIYDFASFYDLEHLSRADPSEGPDVLGQAKCANCAKEFYYYLTSEGYPIVVKNDPPLNVALGSSPPPDTVENLREQPGQPAVSEAKDNYQDDLEKSEQERVSQFEQALHKIGENLSVFERNKRISDALEIIIAEPPPQIEAGFALLKESFKLTARDIEAFRKEVNQKREQIETNKAMEQINAVCSKITKAPKELSEAEKQNAIDYLKDPNLFKNISRDIAIAGGVVGEETNKMMLYLAATSRKFKKPISLVIFGKSSAGKSYLANAIVKFMPEEDTLVLSSMTAKALENMEDQLKSKFILVQEWEGLAETLPTLRTLQSEGKLARLRTYIDPVRKVRVAKAYEQECPCSVIVTTTKESIHDENSTRIFELYVDEKMKKIREVVRANLDRSDMTNQMNPEDKRRILDLHHNVQRLLKPVEVNIPFAKYLSFPAKTSRHQRDSERFINLVKAVAFLRQMQKEKKLLNGVECIDADLDDYRIAYDIGLDIIRATLNTISDRAKSALTVCCELNDQYLAAQKDPLFSITEIQETAQKLEVDLKNRPDLYKQLDELEEYEYLERNQARKNAKKYYRVCFAYERNEAGAIVNIDTPDVKEILTPEQLRDKLENGHPKMVRIPDNPDEDLREVFNL